MTDDRWPELLHGSKDDLVALGVISLNYGYLENMFRALFALATGMERIQCDALFERINNDTRINVFRDIIARKNYPVGLKDLLSHFVSGYQVCAANRHAVMHSHHGGIHVQRGPSGESGIVLSKWSRSGKEMLLFADTKLLQGVADSIDKQASFAVQLILTMSAFQTCERENRLHVFEQRPLPEKPPLPSTLDWETPKKHLNDQPAPESSLK
jgi:hypothetical protein